MDLPIEQTGVNSVQPPVVDMSIFEVTPGSTAPASDGKGSTIPGSTEAPIINIDEDFKGLPIHEAIHRTWQRKHDRELAVLPKVQKEAEENLRYRAMLEDLTTDDDTLFAFLNERKPDLLPKQDLSERIQTELKKQFGDYVPTNDEPRTPGSKAWLYDKAAGDIYTKVTSGQTKFGSLKELREAKERKQQEAIATSQAELAAVAKQYGWDDNALKSFVIWGNGLKAADLAKIYMFATRTGAMRSPSAASVPGNTTGVMSQSREQFLRSL